MPAILISSARSQSALFEINEKSMKNYKRNR